MFTFYIFSFALMMNFATTLEDDSERSFWSTGNNNNIGSISNTQTSADYYLKKYAQIWRLVKRLETLRVVNGTENADSMDITTEEGIPPEFEFDQVNREIVRENMGAGKGTKVPVVLREIIAWLQEEMSNDPSALVIPVHPRQGYWNFTQALTKSDGSNYPVHLDPDALSHQPNTCLHSEDATYEAALKRTLWEYLKRGKIREADDLANQVGRPFLSALLQSGLLYGARKIEDGDDKVMVFGNRNRKLFKNLSKRPEISSGISDPYEKALIGMLAGNIDLIRPVCSSFEDFLFAHCVCLLESYIDECCIGDLSQKERDARKAKFNLTSLIESLQREKYSSNSLRKEENFLNFITCMFILDDIPSLFRSIGEEAEQRELQSKINGFQFETFGTEKSDCISGVPSSILNFMTHLLIHLERANVIAHVPNRDYFYSSFLRTFVMDLSAPGNSFKKLDFDSLLHGKYSLFGGVEDPQTRIRDFFYYCQCWFNGILMEDGPESRSISSLISLLAEYLVQFKTGGKFSQYRSIVLREMSQTFGNHGFIILRRCLLLLLDNLHEKMDNNNNGDLCFDSFEWFSLLLHDSDSSATAANVLDDEFIRDNLLDRFNRYFLDFILYPCLAPYQSSSNNQENSSNAISASYNPLQEEDSLLNEEMYNFSHNNGSGGSHHYGLLIKALEKMKWIESSSLVTSSLILGNEKHESVLIFADIRSLLQAYSSYFDFAKVSSERNFKEFEANTLALFSIYWLDMRNTHADSNHNLAPFSVFFLSDLAMLLLYGYLKMAATLTTGGEDYYRGAIELSYILATLPIQFVFQPPQNLDNDDHLLITLKCLAQERLQAILKGIRKSIIKSKYDLQF